MLVGAGKFAEAALARVPRGPWPFDHAARGLAALLRGDAAAAREHLRRADTHWADRLDAAVLIEELRSALDPSSAPRPRPK